MIAKRNLYRVNMETQKAISYQTYYNVINSYDNRNKYILFNPDSHKDLKFNSAEHIIIKDLSKYMFTIN